MCPESIQVSDAGSATTDSVGFVCRLWTALAHDWCFLYIPMPNPFLEKLFSLDGRLAVVTGGTRGIGQAMAVALAEAGADIILIQRDESNLDTKSQIEALGRKATVYTCDLSSQESVERLAPRILADGHDVSVLVTCAGIQRRHPAHIFPMGDWDEVLQVNLKTVWTLDRDFGAYMLTRPADPATGHRGSIINVASLVSFQGGITVPAYAAAKGGIAQLTKALSNEWASKGVNVNAIAPGYVATDMNEALLKDEARAASILARIPAGRWGNADDFKGATVFLAGRGSLIMATIKASVLYGPKDLRVEERTIPAPAAGEVQVSIRATGICGSDMHYYVHGANGDFKVREPLSLGHESAGVVEAVGPDVTDLKVGDRVAVEVGIACDDCALCKSGRYNLCKGMKFRSSAKIFPHFQGTLQDRINHPARLTYKLPDSASLAEGALLEPLGVAIHGVKRAGEQKGKTALVLGAGAVGLLTAAVLRVEGIESIAIADIVPERVQFAVAHGFADKAVVVPSKRLPPTASADEKLALARETAALLTREGNGGDEYDTTFECTGVESCVQAAIYATGPGGRVMMIGMGTPVQTLPLGAAALREVDLLGVFRYANTYPRGIELLAGRESNGMPDIGLLATQNVKGLDRAEDAFAIAAKPVDADGKLVLKVIIET
ncbi:sorbitol dehydrogenase [Pyricularia oryzae]|nr:sorbitol dehydrogenase [Pyricularia oryzae]KAI7920422.1 sorbitol dehydrogenase [Pyricularia oryzae]